MYDGHSISEIMFLYDVTIRRNTVLLAFVRTYCLRKYVVQVSTRTWYKQIESNKLYQGKRILSVSVIGKMITTTKDLYIFCKIEYRLKH